MSNNILDIFNDNPFTLVELSRAIVRKPYIPNGVTSMGLFSSRGIRTNKVAVEFGTSSLNMLGFSDRGEPLDQLNKRKRDIRHYETLRIGQGTKIHAEELHFLRQFGKAQQHATLAQELADRLGHGDTIGILDNLDLSMEKIYLNVLMGKFIDPKTDEVLIDWNKEFDGSASHGGNDARKEVTLHDNPVDEGDFLVELHEMTRSMRADAGGIPIGKVLHLCSGSFFDRVGKIDEVRDEYLNAQRQAMTVKGFDVEGAFEYGQHIFCEYRGTDDGTFKIPDDEAITIPYGAKGMFEEVFSPAEGLRDIGTKGKRYYAETNVEQRQNPRFVELDAMSYPLVLCRAPRVLRKTLIASN